MISLMNAMHDDFFAGNSGAVLGLNGCRFQGLKKNASGIS